MGLIRWTVAEVRRLLEGLAVPAAQRAQQWHWWRWRQMHGVRAAAGHRARRGEQTPAPGAVQQRIVVVPGTVPLTAKQWAVIAPLLPTQRLGRPPTDHLRILQGILYVIETGRTWHAIPTAFGSWKTIHSRYQRWCRLGIWAQIVAHLQTGSSVSSAVP
jgi:hypothetical protein